MNGIVAKAYKSYKVRRGCVGIIAVEYALVLLVFLAFMTIVIELYRVSLIDQTLARATHLGALAAGRDPTACETAVQDVFRNDRVAAWLFDANGDSTIGFSAGTNPDGSSGQEVGLEITSDNGRITDGVTFDVARCGTAGSWIEVRATVPVRPRFRVGGTLLRRYSSWALNQR